MLYTMEIIMCVNICILWFRSHNEKNENIGWKVFGSTKMTSRCSFLITVESVEPWHKVLKWIVKRHLAGIT